MNKNNKFRTFFFESFIEFFVIMIIIMALIIVFMYQKMTKDVKKEIIEINRITNENFEVMSEKEFRNVEYIVSKLMVDSDVRNFVLGYNSTQLFEKLENKLCIEIQKYKSLNAYIHSIYIYSDINSSVCNGYEIIDSEDFSDMQWKSETDNIKKSSDLCVLHRKINDTYPNVITFIKKLNDYKGNGFIVINVDVEEFAKDIGNVKGNQEKYIICEDNTILYSSDKTLFFKNAESEGILNSLYKNDIYDERKSPYYNWKYISITKYEHYKNQMLNTVYWVSLAGLLILTLTFGISWFFASKSSKPVRKIADLFNNIEDEDIEHVSQYEVESIANSIVRLINKNKKLSNEFKNSIKELNKVQMIALQMQINPHFLYNTLNAISIKAQKEKLDSEVSDMINNLSVLMRISLENKDNLITIENECEYLRLYVDLLKHRYGGIINVSVKDNNLGKLKVIKLMLQPIIENSIYHGILKSNKPGLIDVEFCIRNSNLCIVVKDNGIGMTEEMCQRINYNINNESALEGEKHLGLKNVNDRIKTLFGDNYGVRVESIYNKGTTITVIMPIIQS